MVRTASADTWLDQAAALTSEPTAGCAEPVGADTVAALLRAAQHLRAAPDEGGHCRCGGDPCYFAFLGPSVDLAVCDLVADLARDAGPLPSHLVSVAPPRAAHQVVAALTRIGPAIYHCRRMRHPVGSCWFDHGDTDRCAHVLAIAHRLDLR